MIHQISDMAREQPCDRVVCACPWSWHVVQTEPWREFHALRAVSELPGVKPYLPIEVYRRQVMQHGRPVTPRRVEEAVRALFPGYLFASFDATGTAWGPLLRRNPELRTVRLFTDSAMRPATLPTAVVEGLQARGRVGDGAIDLERRAAVRDLVRGDTVRIQAGPFEGMSALVDASSATRVAVMLGMLRVTLDRADVA